MSIQVLGNDLTHIYESQDDHAKKDWFGRLINDTQACDLSDEKKNQIVRIGYSLLPKDARGQTLYRLKGENKEFLKDIHRELRNEHVEPFEIDPSITDHEQIQEIFENAVREILKNETP